MVGPSVAPSSFYVNIIVCNVSRTIKSTSVKDTPTEMTILFSLDQKTTCNYRVFLRKWEILAYSRISKAGEV